jgi:hypothetical protein
MELIAFKTPVPLSYVSRLCRPWRTETTGLTLLRITDVLSPHNNHDINRGDPNLSLSGGLFLKDYGHVRHDPILYFFFVLTVANPIDV